MIESKTNRPANAGATSLQLLAGPRPEYCPIVSSSSVTGKAQTANATMYGMKNVAGKKKKKKSF
jgi:hypothetical protein